MSSDYQLAVGFETKKYFFKLFLKELENNLRMENNNPFTNNKDFFFSDIKKTKTQIGQLEILLKYIYLLKNMINTLDQFKNDEFDYDIFYKYILYPNVLDVFNLCNLLKKLFDYSYDMAVFKIGDNISDINSAHETFNIITSNEKFKKDFIFMLLDSLTENAEIINETHINLEQELIDDFEELLFFYLKQFFQFSIDGNDIFRGKMINQISSSREKIYISALKSCSVNIFIVKIYNITSEKENIILLQCPYFYYLINSIKVKNNKTHLNHFDLHLLKVESYKTLKKIVKEEDQTIQENFINSFISMIIDNFFDRVDYYENDFTKKITIDMRKVIEELHNFFTFLLEYEIKCK